MALRKAIIVIGNPVDGFEYIGPFDTMEAAARHGNLDGNMPDGEWWVSYIEDPLEHGQVE